MNNDRKAVKALKALVTLNEYFESECVFSNHTQWVDTKGYAFETDMGYFWQGLEELEKCLKKRLRGVRPEYPKACETYQEGEK